MKEQTMTLSQDKPQDSKANMSPFQPDFIHYKGTKKVKIKISKC